MKKKKKDNKIEVVKVETCKATCFRCDGSGCTICAGTGIYREHRYVMMVNGIAFDMDTIK